MESSVLTWQSSLQYVGGIFAVASLSLFWKVARGREPDYRRTLVSAWIFTLPMVGVWLAVALEIGIAELFHAVTR